MMEALTKIFAGFLNPLRVTGPIFDKELRTSSRHRRNFVLRLAYVILLTFFVAAVWADVVHYSYNTIFQKAQMATAGRSIIQTIVTFQFIASQVIAIIMLSTAVSDEILHRTLGVLMTTPITSFQIVTGKLYSKLLQIILLLAISLPLLVLVRIFGGIELSYIISCLCITLTATIFAGSLSLFFSIFSRRAYIVIILTIVTLGILFGLPLLISKGGVFPRSTIYHPVIILITCLNPFLSFEGLAKPMRNTAGLGFSPWLAIHCFLMLAFSSAILFVSSKLVRRVALAQITGQTGILLGLQRIISKLSSQKSIPENTNVTIRRVKGSPIVWKEMISRFSSREKIFVGTIIAVELIMIGAMYLFPAAAYTFGVKETYAAYFLIFAGMGLASIVIFSASCITSEKEAGTWPLLLTTTLTYWEILFGKCAGILRRSIPSWAMLFIFLIPFWNIDLVNFDGLFHLIMLVLGTNIFLCGSGLYFSLRFRHSNTAIAANFILAASFGIIIPLLSAFFIEPLRMESQIRQIFQHLSYLSLFWPVIETIFNHRYRGSIHYQFIYIFLFLGIIFVLLGKLRYRRDVF
jgi:ABC-type transport system involved in multi-copper enzyme maturation permease subunit